MTERAQPGGTPPNACPFLALDDDRDRRSAVPDGRHRCYAESSPLPRALTYQESFCLSAAFPACRSFLDWAARAAAEPLHGAARAGGPSAQPLTPIPSEPQAVAPPQPVVPVEPPGPSLPPPPATYTPPPAWQPPGAVRQDPGTFPWATPPPWVAEPEMRSTASLPPSARPPLDPERPDWGLTVDPWLAEDPEPFETWPPAAPGPTHVVGTFATRRGVDRYLPAQPPPAPGSPLPGVPDPPSAAMAAAAAPPPPAAIEPDDVAAPQPDAAGARSARPEPPASWTTEPVAIPVGDGSSGPPPGWIAPPMPPPTMDRSAVMTPVATAGVPHAMPAATSSMPVAVPPMADPSAPMASAALPAVGAPMPAAEAVTPMPSGEPAPRKAPASRWLPSFLSSQPAPVDPSAAPSVAARTGPVAADAPPDGGWDGSHAAAQDATDAWSVASAPSPWPDSDVAGAADAFDPDLAPAGVAPAGEPPMGADVTADTSSAEDPGALAPRRRKRPGVPVDANAPAAVGSQAKGSRRNQGSGEWNQGRRSGGWRRIIPGVIPPVALGAIVLFLAAAFLFFVPGFLTGSGGATPEPPPASVDAGGVRASGVPARSIEPRATAASTQAFQTHRVVRGDTLLDIARKYGVTQEQLICVNRELRRNPNLLSIGQTLDIPPPDHECPAASKTKKP